MRFHRAILAYFYDSAFAIPTIVLWERPQPGLMQFTPRQRLSEVQHHSDHGHCRKFKLLITGLDSLATVTKWPDSHPKYPVLKALSFYIFIPSTNILIWPTTDRCINVRLPKWLKPSKSEKKVTTACKLRDATECHFGNFDELRQLHSISVCVNRLT